MFSTKPFQQLGCESNSRGISFNVIRFASQSFGHLKLETSHWKQSFLSVWNHSFHKLILATCQHNTPGENLHRPHNYRAPQRHTVLTQNRITSHYPSMHCWWWLRIHTFKKKKKHFKTKFHIPILCWERSSCCCEICEWKGSTMNIEWKGRWDLIPLSTLLG